MKLFMASVLKRRLTSREGRWNSVTSSSKVLGAVTAEIDACPPRRPVPPQPGFG
jgi:hypothetical protein